jgi:hypothetical protein
MTPEAFDVRAGAFFICFNASDEVAQAQIQKKIIKAEFIKSWWNRIPNLYVLETDLPPNEFSAQIHQLFLEETYVGAPLTGAYFGRMELDQWRHLMNVDAATLRRLEIKTTEITEQREQAARKGNDV